MRPDQFPPSTLSPTPDWDELADAIESGEAILLLGPDAFPLYYLNAPDDADGAPREQSFTQLIRQKIVEHPKIRYTYFYERDNLFLFENNDSKKEAKKVARQCGTDREWAPDQELLRQIVAIPFPVILSVTPDTFVRDAFSRFAVPYQFDFYSAKDKEEEVIIEAPKKGRPLLYNLTGSITDFQSIILDYHDMFALLRNLLNDLKVPDALRSKLRRTDKYVLLGFHFDRWYSQLLLHYLNMLEGEFDNSNKTFSILSSMDVEDTRQFIMRQFNLEWIAPSRSDFEQLYAACQRRGILRQLVNPLSASGADLRLRVERNDLTGALEILEQQKLAFDDPNFVPLLKARYYAWLQQSTDKTADSRDLEVEINKIRYTLLTLAAQIP